MTQNPPEETKTPENPEFPHALARHLALEPLMEEFAASLPPEKDAAISPEMLARQAQALDQLFAHFIEQGGVFEEPEAIALALRIQRQCVRTVEIARRSFLPNELKDRKNAR
jgi:hypothetical protein